MIETVLPNVFRIEVPLPRNPLRNINAYVVRSGERTLVVDTGMNQPACQNALEAGFKELDIDRARTDFFITHFHADHLGLVTALASEGSRVYFNAPEAQWVHTFNVETFLARLIKFGRACGFPEEGLTDAMKQHPGIRNSPPKYPEFTILRDGDVLNAGDYQFRCVHTPGHSPGHLCLYETNHRILISGDHVLGDITPNISTTADDTDTLGTYLASLDKVYGLDVALVLPGHRRTFTDFQGRIRELKDHHQEREDEVVKILQEGARTAYETATRMTWDFAAPSWDHFPMMQKWFAVGEAGAHLRHLEAKGNVNKTVREGTFTYTIS
ncbi:MAG TPA: MBL fold metallo-hydrolase [Candidatus Hydrogenedentes bacterium]|nr:MBL fold metallo-hydrolase [Candidatus Hydrogenedentota bacterium]